MLTELAIQNFKCFSALRLQLAPLTLLTGFNGGGKSTSTQPLLLLSQALRRNSNPGTLPLNGAMVKLGTVGDVAFQTGQPAFEVGAEKNESIKWEFATRAGERSLPVTHAEMTNSPQPKWSGSIWPGDAQPEAQRHVSQHPTKLSLSTLSYVTAIRTGTPEVYPFPETDDVLVGDVGSEGQFAAYWYDRLVDEEIDINRCHPSEKAAALRKQLDAYLSSLFPQAQANVTAIPQASALALRFRIGDSSEWRRPSNIGFGLTYAFPILVALLTTPPGQTLVIDSPEAHLHPFVQSQMGRILARAANAGVQIIVETHSDHLLNGVRLAIKEGALRHGNVAIHFFGGITLDGHGIVSPSIDAQGNISDWPTGFFDQAEKDLGQLSGWA